MLADEEPVFLEGLRSLCAQEGFSVTSVAMGREELVATVARLLPDVAVIGLCSYSLGCFKAAQQVVQVSPDTRVLLLTTVLDERRLARAWEAGARGIAPRWLPVSALLNAIQEIAAGNTYIWSAERTLAEQQRSVPAAAAPLTSRECDVLALIADGKSIKQIAGSLSIAPKTAEHHRAHICKKLGVQTTAHLVRCAVRLGLTVV